MNTGHWLYSILTSEADPDTLLTGGGGSAMEQ